MNDKSSIANRPMNVLCVDDEPNILKSIKRLLYKQPYQILLAQSPEKALEILQQHEVHLIMSDMKMPGMTGAQLLEKVATSHPNTYRILLTGYSDIESTVDAINKGRIHRYLQKPWNNEQVIAAIDEGLEQVKLKLENINLNKLIKKQNSLLKELNHNLEEKVQVRTKQIHLALRRIERNNSATQKVLYNFVSINPNLSGGFANSVSQLSKRIAEKLSLSKEQISDVTYASLLCEIGLLGLDTALFSQPFSDLNFNQQQEFIEQTKLAQLILAPAIHLQEVSDIITCQFEYINGSGPNQLADTQIPIGAQILAVARDYWRYTLGRFTAEKMRDKDVRAEMKKFIGTRYSTEVLEVLLNNDDIVSNEFVEKPIPTHALKPGMVLKYNVFTETHMLVLPEGHIFTDSTIAKLLQFEKSQPQPLSLVIEPPQIENRA